MEIKIKKLDVSGTRECLGIEGDAEIRNFKMKITLTGCWMYVTNVRFCY
jgi:hypothetical protein